MIIKTIKVNIFLGQIRPVYLRNAVVLCIVYLWMDFRCSGIVDMKKEPWEWTNSHANVELRVEEFQT